MENLRKISVNYGLLLGLFMIIMTALLYAVDINLFTSSWIGVVNFIIIVVFGVLATSKYKKSVGGFLSFKEAFSAFIITIIIGCFLSTLFTVLLFNVIDTEAKAILSENVIKATVGMMEKFGTSSADLEKMVEEMEKSDAFGPWGQFKGFLFNIVIYSVIGLIVALIMKKERPQNNF